MARKKKRSDEPQPSHEYPTEQAGAFLSALTSKCDAYKKPERPKVPTLREFLSEKNVYEAIKTMLEREKPWAVIAEAVNETFGTALKASTISSAFCYVAKQKGEPRSVFQQMMTEERRRKKAEAAKAAKATATTMPASNAAAGSGTTLGGAPLSSPSFSTK